MNISADYFRFSKKTELLFRMVMVKVMRLAPATFWTHTMKQVEFKGQV